MSPAKLAVIHPLRARLADALCSAGMFEIVIAILARTLQEGRVSTLGEKQVHYHANAFSLVTIQG